MASAVPYLLDSKDCVVYLQAELAKIGVNVTLQTVDNAVIQTAFIRGEYTAMFRNIMSPGEPTYFITQAFTPDQYMSKVSGYTNPKIDELLKIVFAEILRLLADQSPFIWIGYFNATNLWRDRVKNFKPSRGLTINVNDVSLS